MIQVLPILDEPCFLVGLRELVEADPDEEMAIAGQARTLPEGFARASETGADVVVVDISVHGCGCEDIARLTAGREPGFAILALSPWRDKLPAQQAFAAGAAGYLLRSAEGEEIVHAIRTVAKGRTYLDGSLVAGMIGTAGRRISPLLDAGSVSARGIAVLKRTAHGYSAKEIAKELNISQKSVETYKARAVAKLGLESRADIVRLASVCGWFSSSP